MRIRSHLVLLVCSALLPLLIFAAILTGLFWWQQRTAFEQRFLERVRAVSLALDTEIEASIRVLQALELAPEIETNQLARFATRARRVLSSQPTWSAVVLADRSGKQLLRVGAQRNEPGHAMVDDETLKRVLETRQPAISGLVRQPGGNYLTEIQVPLLRQGSVSHILAAAIEPSVWLAFLAKTPMGVPGATMTLLDQSGFIVARTLNNERWVGQRAAQTFILRAQQSPEDSYRNTGLEGQAFYSAYSRSLLSGWIVGTGVPVSSVEELLRESSLLMAIGAALSVALAIWLAFLFGRRVSEPVSVLARSVAALTTGSMPAIGRSGGINELDDVARAFKETGALLQQRERALQSALAGEQHARADAEAANLGKDQFLAMLGHELRNPLSAITNAMTVMNRAGAGSEPAARAREIVERQTSHLRRLVDDLLDIARVTTGKIVLQPRVLDLAELVRRSVSVLRDAQRLVGHEVELELDSVWVVADDTRLEQILANLVENAAKYTPPGGKIRVRVKAAGKDATLEVSDTGAGISADLLPRVFDLFTQGERTLDRSQGGLGLGLTLVRRLVELHHGSVTAASDGQGHGATFTVRLPRTDAPKHEAAPAPATATTARPRRVLIVEDNDDGRHTLRTILSMEGHEVHEAADGPTGVERALSLVPDIALVDIGLPGFDGYELARRVRSAPQSKDIRLVALTGYGQEEDIRRAKSAGFDEYLVKPVEPRTLARVLAEL